MWRPEFDSLKTHGKDLGMETCASNSSTKMTEIGRSWGISSRPVTSADESRLKKT